MAYIDNQGMRIHYTVMGAGTPLVLQHGFFGSIEDWREYGYTSALDDRYTLILIDARGHGHSGQSHDPLHYSLRAAADDVIAILDKLEIDQCHFLGFSMGARIGLLLAGDECQRLKSLIVLDEHPFPVADRTSLIDAARTIRDWVPGMPGVTAVHRERLMQNDPEALAAAAAICFGEVDTKSLAHINIPCLIMAAQNAPDFDLKKRSSEAIRNSEFVRLEGFDHVDMLLRGKDLIPHIVDFLSRTS